MFATTAESESTEDEEDVRTNWDFSVVGESLLSLSFLSFCSFNLELRLKVGPSLEGLSPPSPLQRGIDDDITESIVSGSSTMGRRGELGSLEELSLISGQVSNLDFPIRIVLIAKCRASFDVDSEIGTNDVSSFSS